MSLLNLKKSKPSAKPALRSVEAFIDDAILYAQGQIERPQHGADKIAKPCDTTPTRVVALCKPVRQPKKAQNMRHATFTLTPDCIDKLSALSEAQGTSRSALIREWIQRDYKKL